MPATLSKTAATPADLKGPAHVEHPVNAAVAGDLKARHPNVQRMFEALDRWETRAEGMSVDEREAFFAGCERRIELNRTYIANDCTGVGTLPAYLEGVTSWDIDAARLRLAKMRDAFAKDAVNG